MLTLEIVTHGYVELRRSGTVLSQHTVETKAIQAAASHGPGVYDITYPGKTVRISLDAEVGSINGSPSFA